MQDIGPVLLKKIQEDFRENYDKSEAISRLYVKVRDGTATYDEVNDYAIEVGEILANAYKRNLSPDVLPDGKMYYNIAKATVDPTMRTNYDLVTDVTGQVQSSLNQSAGIGIKAVKPELNEDRIRGIIDKVSNADRFDDVAWALDGPILNFTQSIVDDAIKANAEFQYASGMRPKIVRSVAGNCCEWCRNIAGEYFYPDVPKEVYQRHQRCRCKVEYYSSSGKVQNVHTKKWQTQEERDKIELRKIVGLADTDDQVQREIREKIIPKQNIEKVVKRQEIHRENSKMYEQRKEQLHNDGQYGPSYVTISDDDILRLVKKYSGKGEIKYSRNGKWDNKETVVTNEEIVGVVVNNMSGKSVPTSVFKIHYSDEGIHIVPDYPSKKR